MIFGAFSKSLGGGFRIGIATRLSGRKKKKRSKPTQREQAVEWITEKSDSMNRLLSQFPEDAEIDDQVANQVTDAKHIAEHVLHAGGRMSDAKFKKVKLAEEALENALYEIPSEQRKFPTKHVVSDLFSIIWLFIQIAFYIAIFVFVIKACNAVFG